MLTSDIDALSCEARGAATHLTPPVGVRAERILVPLLDLPLGGTERIAIRLANRWAQEGRSVGILAGTADGALAPMVSPFVKLTVCDPSIRRGRGARDRFGRAIATALRGTPPDVVFIAGNYQWPLLPQIERAAIDVPVVAQISTPLYRVGRGPLAQIEYNVRVRRWLRSAETCISLSDPMTNDADRVLGRNVTVRLPLPALDDLPQLPTPASGRTVLCAGRLVPEKGFDLAIRAFAGLEDYSAEMVILGEGPERSRREPWV